MAKRRGFALEAAPLPLYRSGLIVTGGTQRP